MRRFAFAGLAVLLAVQFVSPASSAELRKRWSLDFSNEPPRMFTYRAPNGHTELYWYMVYSVTNPGDVECPLRIDVVAKTDTGKYFQDSYHPVIEDQIIAAEECLNGLTIGIQKDVIKDLKAKGKYLNRSDMRERATIAAGATVIGLAVLPPLDPNLDAFQFMISGLRDPVRRAFTKPGEPESPNKWIFVNEMLVISYEMPGDAYYKNLDTPQYITRSFERRPIGPIGSLETLDVLVKGLRDENPVIRASSDTLLRRITPNPDGFGYDATADVKTNANAIRDWDEWWHRNKSRVVYEEATFSWRPKEK